MSAYLTKIWFLIPAAGVGSRMGNVQPKQYLQLGGQTLIERVVKLFLELDQVQGGVVGISPTDQYWHTLGFPEGKPWITNGGATRGETVANGLRYLIDTLKVNPEDWVLVHDAARPCVRIEDLKNLIKNCLQRDCGGALGTDLVDTIKRKGRDGRIAGTESRDLLWRAMTPQMFRIGVLDAAISSALSQNISITDESMAMEIAGHPVLMVQGSSDNIKITQQSDIVCASKILNL